jgi:hypothetical protein
MVAAAGLFFLALPGCLPGPALSGFILHPSSFLSFIAAAGLFRLALPGCVPGSAVSGLSPWWGPRPARRSVSALGFLVFWFFGFLAFLVHPSSLCPHPFSLVAFPPVNSYILLAKISREHP